MTNRKRLLGPYVVRIDKLTPKESFPSTYQLKKAKEVLQKQGQIEPAIVTEGGTVLGLFGNDFWYAAKELGWPTFLVAVRAEEEPDWLKEELRPNH